MSFIELEPCSACCSDVSLQLTQNEVSQLEAAGTELWPILPIPDEDEIDGLGTELSWANGVNVLIEWAHEQTDLKEREALLTLAAFAMGMRPGEGLFRMMGKCGNQLPDGKCGDYENRPRICRDFVVGGEGCQRIRKKSAQPVPITLTAKPDNISSKLN